MGLNETIDRLAKEREEREQRTEACEEAQRQAYNQDVINSMAERVFFQRMLKDINHGMSEAKIDEMIDRSLMIAKKLFNKLYQ